MHTLCTWGHIRRTQKETWATMREERKTRLQPSLSRLSTCHRYGNRVRVMAFSGSSCDKSKNGCNHGAAASTPPNTRTQEVHTHSNQITAEGAWLPPPSAASEASEASEEPGAPSHHHLFKDSLEACPHFPPPPVWLRLSQEGIIKEPCQAHRQGLALHQSASANRRQPGAWSLAPQVWLVAWWAWPPAQQAACSQSDQQRLCSGSQKDSAAGHRSRRRLQLRASS